MDKEKILRRSMLGKKDGKWQSLLRKYYWHDRCFLPLKNIIAVIHLPSVYIQEQVLEDKLICKLVYHSRLPKQAM